MMTPFELAKKCVDSINAGFDSVSLIKPKKMPPGFPRGELLCEGPNGKVYRYSAMRILDWMRAHNLIELGVGTLPKDEGK